MALAAAIAFEDAPTLDALCDMLGDGHQPKDLRALHRWLSALDEPRDLDGCAAALEAAVRWLRAGPGPSVKKLQAEPAAIVRVKLLIQVLERVPAWRQRLGAMLARVLAESELEPLFEIGLPNDRGIIEETADRMSRRLLPLPPAASDAGAMVSRVFHAHKDVAALEAMPPELVEKLVTLLLAGEARAPWARAAQAVRDAIALIATRTSALGLSKEIRARSPEVALAASPFFLLPRLCDALWSGIGSTASCLEQIAACRLALESVHDHLEQFGVSVDVVYRIEVIEKSLERLGDLLHLTHPDADERAAAAVALLGKLAHERLRDRSLRDLLRTNVHLLARKIIERAGETGEHYITATRKEWWKMIASASGGGFLTLGTTVLKYVVAWGQFPLFVEGWLASTNYAISFVAMQLLGFTLATKQPSMTAAALAAALHETHDHHHEVKLDELAGLITRIVRSQLAAAIGNLGMVIPTAIAFHFAWLQTTGKPFLDEKAASHTLYSLHPLASGTIFFAALTGVILWMSSLCAGWLENWFVYRRLNEALAHHRFKRLFGEERMRRVAKFVQHHISGFGGNVSLGVLLGMTPVFGKFFGLPLEVRHVTLSTGSLALAVCTLGPEAALEHGWIGAAVGIAIIGTLNFGVSFTLALGVAVRARGVEHAGRRLLKLVLVRFYRAPLEFVFPPR